MPFTIEDFHDLVRMLEERPEWRTELRRLVLTDELLALPEQVTGLRAETAQRLQELAAAQQRTEEHVATLSTQVTELATVQKRTEEQIAQMAEAMRTFTTDVGELKGGSLEADYRTKVYVYFSRLVRRAHALSPDELTSLLEGAIDTGILSADQAADVSSADVIVRGRRREDGAEAFLVVEVSRDVGLEDVERAARRAALLAQTGTPVFPVVAGKWVTPDATQYARASQVWQVTDGLVI